MNIIQRAQKALNYQSTLLHQKNAEIQELKECVLAHQVGYIALVEAWRVSLDHPSIGLVEELDAMLDALRDNVSQTQEYVI